MMTAQHYVVAIGVVRDSEVGWCQATADLDFDGDHIIADGRAQLHAGDPPALACDEAAIAEALAALAAQVTMTANRGQPSPGGLRGPCW